MYFTTIKNKRGKEVANIKKATNKQIMADHKNQQETVGQFRG